jgi:hypothetical protein
LNLQSTESWLPPCELELPDGVLKDILCVRRVQMSLYECEMRSIRGGVFIGGWETKFESFKKSNFFELKQ